MTIKKTLKTSFLAAAALATAAQAGAPRNAAAFDNIIVSPNWINFQQVHLGSSDVEDVTVQNLGDEDIQFLNAYVAGDFQFEVMSMCGYLPRYGSCMLEIRFTPSRPGETSASIQIQGGTAFATVSVSGTGVRR